MADVIEIEASSSGGVILSWRGILAGAAAGSAVSLVLVSLGVAGGLSLFIAMAWSILHRFRGERRCSLGIDRDNRIISHCRLHRGACAAARCRRSGR